VAIGFSVTMAELPNTETDIRHYTRAQRAVNMEKLRARMVVMPDRKYRE
jgi:hypothetical protein